jgi:glycosyltransferase involved in cell wall biosynthesis
MMLGFRKPVSVPPPPAALPLPGPTLHPRMSQSRGLAVSIDCRYIRERPSGIGAYVQALVDRLPALAPAARFQLWVDPRATLPLSPLPNVRERTVRAPANGLSTLLTPSRLVDLSGIDVLHAPFNILGRGIACPTVVTIHDLMWLESPALSEGLSPATPFKAAFYRDGILRALRTATRLVAISHSTADVITRRAPGSSRRVRVIPHGIEARFRPPPDRARAEHAARTLLGIDGPYLLVVGQNTPSKNQRAVLEAFAAAALDERMHLVVLQRLYRGRRVGVLGSAPLDVRARELGVAHRVVFPARLADDAVVRVLSGARALVQFSRYEGFGLPALEALACGTPVVASNIAPLVEVLGGAALHVPLDTAELCSALERVTQDRPLAAELSARGPERARAFSWDRSAALHLETYREAARDG